MPNGPADLTGLRVLMVEDNLLLAEVVAEALEGYGCQVVGPFASVQTGRRMALEAAIDSAVLDVRLCDGLCFPIAAALQRRRVPYLFLTAFAEGWLVPSKFRHVVRLAKPIDPVALATSISESCRVPSSH